MAGDWGPERPGSGLGVRMPPSLGSSSVGCQGWGWRTGASAPGGGLQPPPGTRGSWTKATDCPQGSALLNCWLRFLPSPSRAYLNGVKVRSPWWEEVKRLNEGLRTGFWNGRGSGTGLSPSSLGPAVAPRPAPHQADLPHPPCLPAPFSLVPSKALKPRCACGSQAKGQVQRGWEGPGFCI